MKLDDIHAIIPIGCRDPCGIGLAGVNTALKIEEGLIFVEAKFLLLSDHIQKFLPRGIRKRAGSEYAMKAHQRREHAQRIVSLRTLEPGSLTIVHDGLDILLKCKYIAHHLVHSHRVDSPDILRIGYQKTLHEVADSLEDEPKGTISFV